MMELLINEKELGLILADLNDKHGYDFSAYSKASLTRRVNRIFALDRFPSFAEFRYQLKSDQEFLKRFVEEITVNLTEMFRDPSFYQTLRENVLPTLGTYPLIRIWHAGCSTGEEVYSLAILLKEMNLLHKSILYATDINPSVIKKARNGIFPLSQMKKYSENYINSGGKNDFSKYYSANYNMVKFDKELSRKMVFSTHNLVSDSSFNTFQLIICRNVLIYFEKDLQERVLNLFNESLDSLSFLGLGSKETIKFSSISKLFKQVTDKERIWRKYS